MTPDDLDLAAALRQLLRHPLVRDELRTILAEAAPAAGDHELEGYITSSEAARRAGVKPAALRAWIARGILPATKIPRARGWKVKAADLEELLAGQRGRTPVLDLSKQRQARADALVAAAHRERER